MSMSRLRSSSPVDTPSSDPINADNGKAARTRADTAATAVEARGNGHEGHVVTRIIWIIMNILFLDFARKFEHRLEIYAKPQSLQDVDKWREGQQQEWDRLGTTISLLATISAASLAFSGIDNSWWVARAVFAGALGLSLCGFFVIHYFGVLSEGMRDDDMHKAVKGDYTERKVVSCALAVPVVITAYSTLLILLGHCIFVITISSTGSLTTTSSLRRDTLSEPGFKIIAGFPILCGICMMIGAVVVSELMYNKSYVEETSTSRRSYSLEQGEPEK
ncbi:hypothetical protein FIBSPDRAFT_1049747 [Athelia psychrophila]|uniref:Uncharacterized protein n=1 Tax=Athelia psychrophila TaxID=1759441 RepID=A0A166BSJ0_9AGAM|nr:hypothetical protein FIBSPDRAFT_1049747 [Fibularhizoctonia sp. CBS 109695]